MPSIRLDLRIKLAADNANRQNSGGQNASGLITCQKVGGNGCYHAVDQQRHLPQGLPSGINACFLFFFLLISVGSCGYSTTPSICAPLFCPVSPPSAFRVGTCTKCPPDGLPSSLRLGAKNKVKANTFVKEESRAQLSASPRNLGLHKMKP